MILALQTTTFSAHGGIPTYNRLVCRALNEMDGAGGHCILIATDDANDVSKAAVELPKLRLEGFAKNRLALAKRLLRLALFGKFDVALIGHVNYAPLGWLLKRVQPRLRYGVMLYGIDAWQQLKGIRGHALRKADFLISISEYTKQRAVEINGLPAQRIYVLLNALEWKESEAAMQKKSVSPTGTQLLSVCRLEQSERYKGVDHVIEVLPEVVRSVPDLQYTVIGGGTDLQRHRELAQRLGVADRVHFLGFVPDDILREHYRRCDLFVMPSAAEGFGFVFLEAMKHAKPILAASSGGAPEVVLDGITGTLVEYGAKAELMEGLLELCLSPEKRSRLGQAGYDRLQEKFTYPQFKMKLTEIVMREMPLRNLQEQKPFTTKTTEVL